MRLFGKDGSALLLVHSAEDYTDAGIELFTAVSAAMHPGPYIVALVRTYAVVRLTQELRFERRAIECFGNAGLVMTLPPKAVTWITDTIASHAAAARHELQLSEDTRSA